ncbi:DUF5703 domain-containing protein, partial [bacterium]|nr:DUF5703 domain-containing protein [bacterium]
MLKHFIIACSLLASLTSTPFASTPDVDLLSKYNVVWNSPSQDHNGSMPIGNGDIGMNVWAEPDGGLVLLLSKTDAWSENAALLKLGRVRMSFSPNPFAEGKPFEQTLRLHEGEITINAGQGNNAVAIQIWVDANHPVIHIKTNSETQYELTVDLDVWRTQKRELKDKELN